MKGYLLTIFNSYGMLTDFIIKDTYEEAEEILIEREFKQVSNGYEKEIISTWTPPAGFHNFNPIAEPIIIGKASIVKIQDERDMLKGMIDTLTEGKE